MKKILIVVDYQNDFVNPNGALPVPNAINIVDNIQSRIDSDEYSARIYTFDTHTAATYKGSPEEAIFPIHCEYGTEGWKFYNIKPIQWEAFEEVFEQEFIDVPFEQASINDEYFFTKDVFNIWDGNADYPKWFEEKFPADEYQVDVVGVATNYCIFMNVMGMIERGYKVNIISDCVEGIKNFPDGSVDASYDSNKQTMIDSNVTFI